LLLLLLLPGIYGRRAQFTFAEMSHAWVQQADLNKNSHWSPHTASVRYWCNAPAAL